jgi:hypothetical protein
MGQAAEDLAYGKEVVNKIEEPIIEEVKKNIFQILVAAIAKFFKIKR